MLLTRKRVCAAKIESVAGTAETLAGADAAENFENPSIDPEIPAYERQGQLSVSPITSVPGARSANAKFRTYLYNAATTPFWVSVLLPAVGLNGSGPYAPVTGGNKTITFGYYVDGNKYAIAGAMGNLKIVADKVGEPVKLDWEFRGLWVPPSATALLTPSAFPGVPPRFAGATITIAGTSYVVSKVEIDLGNQVVMREDATETTGSGYRGSVITARNPKVTIDVEVPAIGTHDFYNEQTASTESAFSMAVGSGTNGVVTIAAPKMQMRTGPKMTDKEGLFCYTLEYGLNRSAVGGDDELSITLS